VILTRSPLGLPQCCHWMDLVRLACVKHAASVRPEPGSNSPSRSQPAPASRFEPSIAESPTTAGENPCAGRTGTMDGQRFRRPFDGALFFQRLRRHAPEQSPALAFVLSSVFKERARSRGESRVSWRHVPPRWGWRCHWPHQPEGPFRGGGSIYRRTPGSSTPRSTTPYWRFPLRSSR
jgi:hypothetical protein